jgi:hypothetical protein
MPVGRSLRIAGISRSGEPLFRAEFANRKVQQVLRVRRALKMTRGAGQGCKAALYNWGF